MEHHRHYYLFLINNIDIADDIKTIVKGLYFKNPRVLSDINPHPRDRAIKFYEVGHKYDLTHPVTKKVLNPVSVTTLIHHYFPDFDADAVIAKMMKSRNWPNSQYFGMAAEDIKAKWEKDKCAAADAGTQMHAGIEDYYNGLVVNNKVATSVEYSYFTRFWKDFSTMYPTFKPYRTEFLVWDEDFRNGSALCGSIDFLLKDDKNNYIIMDWKRSREIKFSNQYETGYRPFHMMDHCNYNHYTLQLNIYRHILQTKYQMNVIFLMLVILHPNQQGFFAVPVRLMDMTQMWLQL